MQSANGRINHQSKERQQKVSQCQVPQSAAKDLNNLLFVLKDMLKTRASSSGRYFNQPEFVCL